MNNTSVELYKPSEQEINIFKKSFAPKATAAEWELFLYTCEAYGLSPLKRQIYLVSRWDNEAKGYKATPQISIDGLRLLAQRTKEYEGRVGPFWCDDNNRWFDVWLDLEKMPRAAVVGVWRKNFRQPLFGVVNFEAVAGTKKGGELNHFWQKMGPHMLAKCAEAAALRAAFPEVDGLYIHEEMNQADVEASMITVTPEPANDPDAPEILAQTPKELPTEATTKASQKSTTDAAAKAIAQMQQATSEQRQRAMENKLMPQNTDEEWNAILDYLQIKEIKTGKDVYTLRTGIDLMIREAAKKQPQKAS